MRQHKGILIILIPLILIQTYCFSIASANSASSATDDWTMFRHDPDHSGSATSSNSMDSAKLLWTYKAGRMVQSSPAVANGCIFIGCRDSVFYCLSSSNGQLVWRYPIHKEVWSSPAIYYGYVYIGADDGYVYCLNMTTGQLFWRTNIGGAVRSSPAIADGLLYIGSGNHDVFCINASDGTILWSFPTLKRVNSSPAVSNGVVYVATDDYFLYAINASTGTQLWSLHTGTTISSPSVYNDYVYVGSIDGYVCALNASTGAKIWQYQTQDAIDSSPAFAYGYVYVGSEDNNLYCLNGSTGQKIWQSQTGYWVTSSPALAHGNVYVGSEDYNVYCFDAFTGDKKWSYATGNFVVSSPAIADDTLYVGSDDFCIYAFALSDSASESLPLQSSYSLAWTTAAFDVIACVVLATVIFLIVRFARSNRQANRSTEPINSSGQNYSWFSAHLDAVFIVVILLFSTIFFVNLGSGRLWVSDEVTYSQWAFHMVKNGDYLNPWAAGELSFWIAKPPLYAWLMSLAYQIFGVSNFSSRLSSAVFGVLSLVLVFFLGKKLYNQYVGFLSAIVLGTFTTFYAFATHAMTDLPFTFFIMASLYFLVLSEKTEKTNGYLTLSGMFFGLALMTKQVEALIIPLVAMCYLAVTKRSIRFLFAKRFARFWEIGLLVFAPWLIYMILSFGPTFWESYFLYSALTRTLSPIEGHAGGYLFYFSYLVNSENPLWVILLPFAAGLCTVNTVLKRSKADTLIFIWMVIVLSVFTFVQTKLYWYILPALPAFALAIGSLLYQLSKKISLR